MKVLKWLSRFREKRTTVSSLDIPIRHPPPNHREPSRLIPAEEPEVPAIEVNLVKRTTIVPTLDTPSPEGNNVVWCSSFQLAWEELRKILPEVGTAKSPLVRSLNRYQNSADDIQDHSFYAAAGFIQDGIIEKVRREMFKKFPKVTPTLPDPAGLIHFAYSYLTVRLMYETPFNDNDKPLTFKSSDGSENAVRSFGIRTKDGNRFWDMRNQVAVLYEDRTSFREEEYILDLSARTQPYQILIARIRPGSNLTETHMDFHKKIENRRGYRGSLLFSDTLLVPKIFYKVSTRYPELEEFIEGLQAIQDIRFKLDRTGAELDSEAAVMTLGAGGGVSYIFDRPFLVVMRKRNRERPFFVMWVENSELLSAW